MANVEEVTGKDVKNTTLKEIPLSLIRESQVSLRGVKRNTEKYMGIVESIRRQGVLIPILVREIEDDHGTITYGLIDGLHRFTAAKDAGLSTIPANIKNMDDGDLLEAQVIANYQKMETNPAQYSLHLVRILASNPLLTKVDLASRLSVTKKWLDDRLSLTNLAEPIQELVDNGKIKLSNAYALAKLPVEEQPSYVDRAMTDPPTEFTPAIAARVKEIKDAAHEGRTVGPKTFTPQQYLQKLGDVKSEFNKQVVRDVVLKSMKAKTPEEVWKACLTWLLHMDPDSQSAQTAKDNQRKVEREEQKNKNKIERDQRKKEEAAREQQSIEKL